MTGRKRLAILGFFTTAEAPALEGVTVVGLGEERGALEPAFPVRVEDPRTAEAEVLDGEGDLWLWAEARFEDWAMVRV